MHPISVLIERTGALADRPGNSDEQRLKNRFLVIAGLGMGSGGLIWGMALGALGLWWQAIVPLSYTAITAVNFTYLHATGAFRRAANIQVSISVLLPFLLQWSLGGFVSSGGMMVWAFISVIAAQSLADLGRPTPWWAVMSMLIVVSALLETSLPVPPLLQDRNVGAIAFAINFAVVGSLLLSLTSYSLRLQHNWGLQLADKNRQIAESQQALVQAEKMAALGRLSAGLAHEMNNPAGAVRRGAEHLREAVENLFRIRFELGQIGLGAEQLTRVNALAADVRGRLGDAEPLDPLERADREDAVELWIERHGIEGISDFGSVVECGFTAEDLDDLGAVFNEAQLSLVLRQQCAWQTTVSLLQELGLGAERISTLVNALRSYTYLDQGRLQAVNVNEGLQSTLTMLGTLLQGRVTVHRHFDESLPRIEASGGELNQVWTNLIENAVSAMNGVGELEVHTLREGEEIVVRIVDNGTGIPDHIRDRLFDPFVTTKPVGEGTGLGLNISRNIVVKTGGTMVVDSHPGRTSFEVRLPIHYDAA